MSTLYDSSLVFLGDIYLPEPFDIPVEGNIVFNHEYVISEPTDEPYKNKVNLVVRENTAVKSFTKATSLFAHLDNNHVMDFGDDALSRTVRLLIDQGVFCYGNNIINQSTVIHELAGAKFCLLGYNMTAPSITLDPDSIITLLKRDIPDAISNGAAKIFATIHFGEENLPRSLPKQEKVARAAIDLGAEMVIGHHTHCVQNIETYKGKYIFYSLGNSFFPELDVPSHFDTNNTPHDRFRIRETRWNTSGLMVLYDLFTGKVTLRETTCRKCRFLIGQETFVYKINRKFRILGNSAGYLRRIYGFIKNYSFYDGMIFDTRKLTRKLSEKMKYWCKRMRRPI